MSNIPLSSLCRHRFPQDQLPAKNRIWKVLRDDYFQALIGSESAIVLAAR